VQLQTGLLELLLGLCEVAFPRVSLEEEESVLEFVDALEVLFPRGRGQFVELVQHAAQLVNAAGDALHQ
jgi:predicted metal-dependent hydrolase